MKVVVVVIVIVMAIQGKKRSRKALVQSAYLCVYACRAALACCCSSFSPVSVEGGS